MRTLIVVSGKVTAPSASAIGPRKDYHELIAALGADVLDPTAIDASWSARAIRLLAGRPSALAWLAFRAAADHDVIFTDGEHIGIPLALLMKAFRTRARHVTIGHRLTSAKKRPFFRRLRAHDRMDRIIVHSSRQAALATSELGISPDRIRVVPYQVDTSFWRPQATPEERLITSGGLESRDYPTLIESVRDLDVSVVISAGSSWSKRRDSSRGVDLPANVTVGSLAYSQLRDLYARAAAIVVPLAETDFQAGVTTILEAMAMGKLVIVTRTSGQIDVVADRRSTVRWEQAQPRSLIQDLAEARNVPVESNGFYVPPGDPEALRRAIGYVIDHPEERARLGRAGRRAAESYFTLEAFVQRVSAVLREVGASEAPAPPHTDLARSLP
jgi:glycosyltransferase involved in cell wall biosynthesis